MTSINYVFLSDEDGEETDLKKNGRKVLIPLFCFEILRDNTNPRKQFSQDELRRRLDEYPYSISVGRDRKLFYRALNLLLENFPEIRRGSNGFYYDRHAA